MNRSVNELPLNARDSYQFLQLQPGVQSQLGSSGGTFYGSDSAGSVSVNGGRDRANNFSVNGGDANDQFVNLPTIQPTPDAIEEFRVISNTFDAEYGRNSGAVVNVVTKSGTNQWHGNVYEFFRNKVLNAQGLFQPDKATFQPEPVRRNIRWSDQEGPYLLLCVVRRTAANSRRFQRVSDPARRAESTGNFSEGPALAAASMTSSWRML